jgi:hypothetical protein
MGSQPRDGTLVEFRSEKAIVHAATYVEAELKANLELQSFDLSGETILKCVLDLLQKIGLGRNKQLLLESTDALIEALSLLKAPEPMVIIQPPPQEVPAEVAEVEAELARRAEMRERVSTIQEELLNQRDVLTGEFAVKAELVRHKLARPNDRKRKAELEKEIRKIATTIEAITAAIIENDREVGTLVSYREACKFVKRGLPRGIIGRNFNVLSE